MFGQDLMHCFKTSSSEWDMIVDFGVDYDDINKNISSETCEITKGCFFKLHSNSVCTKAINKDVDLKFHSSYLNIKEI